MKPTGPVYHGAAMVTAAIDRFATVLPGERYYFHADGSATSETARQQAEETEAREKGEKLWDRSRCDMEHLSL